MFTTFAHAGHDHSAEDQSSAAHAQEHDTMTVAAVEQPTHSDFSAAPFVAGGAGIVIVTFVVLGIFFIKSKRLSKKR